VIAMLLGNVLVTQDLTAARAVARETGYRYKIVTCQGEVISRGLFTGGAERNQGPGLLQRRQTIAALQQQVQALSQEAQAEASSLSQVEESLTEVKSAIFSLEESLPSIREESQRQRQLVLEARENMDSHQRGVSLCRQKEDQFKQRLSQAQQQIAELEVQVEQCILRLDTCNSLREMYKRAEGISRDYVEQQNSRLKGLQLTWLSLKGQADARRRELEQNQQRLRGMKQRLGELEGQVQTVRKQATELGEKLMLLQENLSVTDSRQQEGRQQQLLLKHQREARLVELDVLASDLQSFEDEAKSLESRLHDLSVKEARWETEQEVMVSELAERHGLQPEVAMNSYEPDLSVGEINTQLKTLRQEIQSLGEVNLAAIGQHQRLLERLEFLSQQQTDLLQGEKDISRLIGELDTTIKKLFLDTFNQVQEHFGRIFRELFEGGTAYLSLSNQEEVFETGIEIFAQPPGKRIQSLSLLSGGEKAMTAIALMFSLLSVQPAPFCILDEIEAALDDINILRFARYLKNLALDMQFLIITHRRETMEYADNLYGVTLDGNSSSKLVSVTLNQQAG
jgi:chromosome segregation protein